MKWCMREFRLYELPALESWLQNMAEKGWMLKTIRVGNFFGFEKIEPTRMLFSAKVIGEMSILGAENCEVARDYRSYCEEAGWRFVTSNRVMQIFAAPEENHPVPIATDEELEYEAVWKQTRKGIISQGLLAVFWLCYTAILTDAESLLRGSTFGGAAVILILCGYLLFDVGRSLLWYFRARKARREFRKVPYYGASEKGWTGKWMLALELIFLALALAFFLSVLFSDGVHQGLYLIIYFLGYLTLMLVIQWLIRKRGFSKGAYVVLALVCGVGFAIVMIVTLGIIKDSGIPDNPLLSHKEDSWVLTEADLGIPEESLEEIRAEADRSPLGKIQEYWAFSDVDYVSYTFYETRWDFLREQLKEEIKTPYKNNYADVTISGVEKPVKTISGVKISGLYKKMVLKETGEELEEQFRGYLFEAEDSLLFLRDFGSELTEEELWEVVAEKLKES